MTEETIFTVALDKQTPAERSAFLDEACGDDAALRRRVEALIDAHERAADFLEKPAVEQIASGVAEAQDRTEATDAIKPAEQGIAVTPAHAPLGETQAERPADREDVSPLDFLAPPRRAGALGRLDHYEVLAVVGRGGMGMVLKAFDEELQRVVAIKVMAPQLAATASARKRFHREAKAAAAVRDEHVINIHGIGEAHGLPYLVMEYISGLSLQERLDQSGPLELKEILRIGMQTANGLAKAHTQGLIHRDIKPANILLENGVQRVKLTDFGLARAVDDASLTQSGVIAGTPQYMAPEQARGEAVDHRADLFSLGSVLYAMCTGHAPFRASTTMAVLKRVCEDTPRPVREINPEIPDWLCAIIDKLHAREPAQRFQSAAEVAELLGQHLAHLQQPALVPLPSRVERPTELRAIARAFRSRRYRRVLIVALLLLALGVAACRWFSPRVWGSLTGSAFLEVDLFSEEFEDLNVDFQGVTAQSRQGTTRINTGSWAYLSPGMYEFRPEGSWKGWPENLDQYQMVVSPPTLRLQAGQRYKVTLSLRRRPAPNPAEQIRPERTSVSAKPFAICSRPDQPERLFASLNEAVAAAQSGDAIEVRGDGPFACEPIHVAAGQALTIRAGTGFQPVLTLQPKDGPIEDPLLETDAPLVLEGLTLERLQPWGGGVGHPERNALLLAWKAPLHAANCRFLTRTPCVGIWAIESAVCELRNCTFGGLDLHAAVDWTSPPGGSLALENCLLLAGPHGLVIHQKTADVKGCSVRLRHNTLSAYVPLDYWLWASVQDVLAQARDKGTRLLRIEAEANLFDTLGHVLDFKQIDQPRPLAAAEAEAALPRFVSWRERRNVYPARPRQFLLLSSAGSGEVLGTPVAAADLATTADWARYWAVENADSAQGVVRYEGGDVMARARSDPEKVRPPDFRLRRDSAGKAPGEAGRDLGADVDLVGPGAAYEAWKKTPDYQRWRKDTEESAGGKR